MVGAGFFLGRVVAVPVAARVPAGRVLAVSLAASLIVSGAFVTTAEGGAALWVISFVFGVSVAPQYAAMLGLVESHLALSGGDIAVMFSRSVARSERLAMCAAPGGRYGR